MKHWALLLTLCLQLLLSAAPLCDRTLPPHAREELAALFDIPPSDLLATSQANWLRRPTQERWQMTELPQEQREAFLQWAQTYGLFDAWTPTQTSYDTALILGATTGVMQQRLNYLIQLYKSGLHFSEILFLTGDRPLDPTIDAPLGTNESEAARIIWDQTPLPDALRALPVHFIAVPMKGDQRPNTADTLIAWLATNPPSKSALFISSQPFCGYQSAIVKTLLPAHISFDTVGPAANPSSHPAAAAITLDALARWLWQETQIR